MSTHNRCFGSKIRIIGIPLQTPFFYMKVGFKGCTFHGHVFLIFKVVAVSFNAQYVDGNQTANGQYGKKTHRPV